MSKPKDVLTSYLIFIFYYHFCDQSSRSLFLVCISFIVEACVYMGFSIIAVALGGIITIVYSVKIFLLPVTDSKITTTIFQSWQLS